MKRRVQLLIFISVLIGMIWIAIPQVNAQGIFDIGSGEAIGLGQNAGKVSFSECIGTGDCGVEHIFILANNLVKWMIGVSGALALLMYIIGGVWMLFSSGNTTRIERGKDILIGTTTALIFILASWLIVSFILTALDVEDDDLQLVTPCGTTTCQIGQTCADGRTCVDRCSVDHKGEDLWRCQQLEDCGLSSWDECGEPGKPACEKYKCPGDKSIVCCPAPKI